MTVEEVMAELKGLGQESVRKMNSRNGYVGEQFGCRMGDLRVIAKRIKLDPELAMELWRTGNLEARLLAVLLMKPKLLTFEDLTLLLSDITFGNLADWVNSYVIKAHPKKEEFRQIWMQSSHSAEARAGWSLTCEKVIKEPESLDIDSLLDRLESEMPEAPELVKWTMNFALGYIGIHSPSHRERAVQIGEKIGAYRDYPVSKGCTSPFVPIWVNEMVQRGA